jgi:hypothetical protein
MRKASLYFRNTVHVRLLNVLSELSGKLNWLGALSDLNPVRRHLPIGFAWSCTWLNRDSGKKKEGSFADCKRTDCDFRAAVESRLNCYWTT